MSPTPPLFVPGQQDIVQQTDVNYRWATVTQTDPLRIRLDGDTTALPVTPENLTGEEQAVGARVWVQFYGRRILVLGASGGAFSSTMLRNLKSVASGGGLIDCTQTAIGWSERFILLGAGRNAQAPAGFFDITMPPNGTIVHGVGNVSDITVSGGLIDFGTNSWFALWYALPAPGSMNTTVNSNFYATGYNTNNFTIPSNWVCVATHNPESEGNVWHTIDGRFTDPWRFATGFQNGWTNYGAPYAGAAYKKEGNLVIWRGLVTGGTVSSSGTTGNMFNAPAGFRPAYNATFSVMAGSAGGPARVEVTAAGDIRAMVGPAGTYWSLDNVRYIAEQ